MYTKRHYIDLLELLAELSNNQDLVDTKMPPRATIDQIVIALSSHFSRDNDLFQPSKFTAYWHKLTTPD